MFWKYTQFEIKLLLGNRKSWFIALFLLLFFIIYFAYYSQVEPATLIEQKRIEKEEMNVIFENVEYLLDDIPEVGAIHENLLKQSSLINFQVYYLGIGEDSEQYIENGLELNQLRLEAHELGNKGIPEHLVKPKSEILKEDALLHYIKENNLPIEEGSFVTNHYFVNVLNTMNVLLILIILISGNELLLSEKRHLSVVKGFPLSFLKKITSKVVVHFVFVYSFLIFGFLIGGYYLIKKLEVTNFSFPILVYQNGDYIAISTWQYLIYMFLGMAIVTLLLLYSSVLLNMLFQNAFANILVGLGIFALPDLLMATGLKLNFLYSIKFIDIASILSGDLANQTGAPSIDYLFALIWIVMMIFIVICVIAAINKYMYIRKPKEFPLVKPF